MKYAWIENSVIRDLCASDPAELFTPQIAAFYSVEVPEDAEGGDGWDGETLTKPIPFVPDPVPDPLPEPERPPIPEPEPLPPVPPKVLAIEYKMLFTSAERIATKASTDPVIIDLQDLMNDPRTQNVDLALKSVQDALDYMTYIEILAPGRKEEILTGVPL